MALFWFGHSVEKASNVLLPFAPPGGTFALALFPYKEILPLRVKLQRYRYLKNSYLNPATESDPSGKERRASVREELDKEPNP